MLNKRISKVAIVGAIMIIMGAKGQLATVDADNITGKVTATTLNVRSGASTSHSVVGKLSKGTEVDILSTNNGWHEVRYSNNTGHVSADYINTNNSTSDSNTSSSNKGTVTASSLNVRSGASTSHSVVGKLSKGTKVDILSTNNGWHEVRYSNNTGHVSADYINTNNSSSDSNTSASKQGTVSASSLNVRSGASTSYSVVGKLSRGTKVDILSTNNGWHQVRYSGNNTGYVSADYVLIGGSSNDNSSQVGSTLDVKAYAYTGGGITATGTKPKYGTLAVDPKVIPYGTKVYIKELDKVFIAEDCGGGIKGNKIDIYMPTNADCNKWGVRNITIEILK